jgi:hypothetical protein
MWKLTAKAEGQEPLPGIPWRDMDEAEFEEVAKQYSLDHQFPKDALHKSGFFEKVDASKGKGT